MPGTTGQIARVQSDGSVAWETVAELTNSRAPSGSAGGTLGGSYPNPTVNTDGSTLETNSNALRVKALGITDSHVAAANKDGTAGTASMRTLGTGAAQAAAGNAAPNAHHASHEPGGTDAMAVDAAAATASLRTLGPGATQSAPGELLGSHKATREGVLTIAALTAAGTYLLYPNGSVGLAAAGSGFAAFYRDPADHAITGRTTKVRVRAWAICNAVAPAVNLTTHLYPVATWNGASGVRAGVATVGASVCNAAINAPGASGPTTAVSVAADHPAAGYFVLALVLSGQTAANSAVEFGYQLQMLHV